MLTADDDDGAGAEEVDVVDVSEPVCTVVSLDVALVFSTEELMVAFDEELGAAACSCGKIDDSALVAAVEENVVACAL